MLENIPNYVTVVFGLTTVLSFVLMFFAINKSLYKEQKIKISLGVLLWVIIHGILGFTLFYKNTIMDIPPKLPLFGLVPLFLMILYLFNSEKGKSFIDSLPLKQLTLISVVRIPVEIVLWWLFLNEAVPKLMSFEGRNHDILAGLTAPIIILIAFKNGAVNKKLLLGWNIICLSLLLNIIVNALLSFPSPIQQQAFDMPNVGLLYFPFIWLPTFVAPLVLITHFISIRQLTKKEAN